MKNVQDLYNFLVKYGIYNPWRALEIRGDKVYGKSGAGERLFSLNSKGILQIENIETPWI